MDQDVHPSPTQLAAYARGELDDAAHEGLECHLTECQTCCDALRGMTLGDWVGGLVDDPPKHTPRVDGTLGLAGSNAAAPTPTESCETPSKVIGNYKLLQQIGEGGFGIVYMAQQEKPVSRRVALKIIKPGMDSRQVIARFEAERQALAMMDHPHIAKVLDAGTMETGGPYFVMELVKGIAITTFCDDQKLTVHERLRLFVPICHAVQHAHQKGVIHRDIKPSNLLVSQYDGEPVPKVIDFGIAKAIHQPLTDKTMFTQFGQVIGTLEYMSPEQSEMNQLDVDTRSDIYSLGAVLYELMTGTTPIKRERLRAAALDEMLRMIREEEPQRPSLRLSTSQELALVAAQRNIAPAKLSRYVRGELDWIVMKALEKQRSHRYETADSLARDIERYLNDEPVDAGPPSAAYRFRKFARRNQAALATAAIVSTALLLGTAVSTWQALRASQAEAVAKKERNAVVEAHDKAETARREAQAYAEVNRQRLVRSYVDHGVRLMDQGDLMGSVIWFAEALNLDEGHPEREDVHRTRIAAVLRRCPKLTQVWFHDGPVFHAEFSPDCTKCVTASGDAAQVWDVATGTAVATLRHNGSVRHATFNPDGSSVVTASHDTTARVWDAATGRPRTPPLRHSDEVRMASFSPDGHSVVTASFDGTARVWEATTGESLCPPLRHNNDAVNHAAFSPDGRYVLTASGARTADSSALGGARVWDAATGQPVTPYVSFLVIHALFNPDGRSFVVAGVEGSRVWDALTGEPVSPPLTRGSLGIETLHASFSSDGLRVVTASRDGTAMVWDASTGQALSPPMEHNGFVRHVSFSQDGQRVITASNDGSVRVWDATTGKPLASPLKHGGFVYRAELDSDGRRVLTASGDGTVRLWDTASGEPLKAPLHLYEVVPRAYFSHPDGRYVFAFALGSGGARVWAAATCNPTTPLMSRVRNEFSAEGRLLARSAAAETAELWDAATGQLRWSLEGAGRVSSFSGDGRRLVTVRGNMARVWDATSGQPLTEPLDHEDSVRSASFDSNGRRLVTVSGNTVRVWDAHNGQPMTQPQKHDGLLLASLSPNGHYLLTMGEDEARVWDASTGKPLTSPLKHASFANNRLASFSPDSRRLVTRQGNAATIWDAVTGQTSPPLTHSDQVWQASFSFDGQRLVTASSDRTARVWDAATGEALTPPMEHGGSYTSGAAPNAEFSPNGLYIVTASSNHTARVWDAATGQAVTPTLRHRDVVPYAEFSPDGRRVVTAGWDGTARVWDLPSDVRPVEDLMRLGEALAGHRIDATGGLAPFDQATFQTAWGDLRSKYPEEFVCSPDEVVGWHRREAERYEEQEQWSNAVSHLDVVVSSEMGCWSDYSSHSAAHAQLGQWEKAAAGYLKVIELGPADDYVWYSLALAQLGVGDTHGYRDACASLLNRCADTGDANRIAWTCVLGPDAVADLSRPVHLAEQAVADGHFAGLRTLGAAFYRAGRFGEAVEKLNQSTQAQGGGEPLEWIFLAMAHYRLGHAGDARNWLDKAGEWIERNLAGGIRVGGKERLEHQLLRREAEALLGTAGS